jgi:hypothetical protein
MPVQPMQEDQYFFSNHRKEGDPWILRQRKILLSSERKDVHKLSYNASTSHHFSEATRDQNLSH